MALLWNLTLNIFRWIATRRCYVKFLSRENDMLWSYASIERLFDKAGVNEVAEYTSHGPVKIARYIENPMYRNEVEQCFRMAESVYVFRIKNSFNILYILEFPFRRMKLLKRPPSPLIQVFFAFIFWLISAVGCGVVSYFVSLFLNWFISIDSYNLLQHSSMLSH